MNRRWPRYVLASTLGFGGFAALYGCAKEGSLGDTVDEHDSGAPANGETPGVQREPDAGVGTDATAEVNALPGTRFDFDLNEQVYIDLSIPAVVQPSNGDTFAWDLLFDGLAAYTNGGAVGPGYGASFGPSSELDLLFDAAPAVPLRADVSDNAMLGWYWFGDGGVTSRFRTYGVRNTQGRLFKLQVLSYYDNSSGEQRSAVYTLRFAEVTEGGSGDVVELSGVDASAGGITLPPSSPAGCVNLAEGVVLQLAATEWSSNTNWDLCFQRTEVYLNAGLSGQGGVKVVDLDLPPGTSDGGVTAAEQQQTAEGALERFYEIDHAVLTQPGVPWEQQYEARPRIGTRWLSGDIDNLSPAEGSWIIRGANGENHYALYFLSIAKEAQGARAVSVQVKPLAPPTLTE